MYQYIYDNSIIYPIHVSNEKFSDKSHYVYIKDFNRLMFNKSKNKNKKYFCRYCLQCFSSESICTEHKENCLVINGKQCLKLSKGFISFKNYSRQIPVPFKTYVDFEFILKETEVSEEIIDKNTSYTKKYQSPIPCSFGYKVICLDKRFSKDIVIFRGKKAINEFITMILKEYEYCSNIMKKYFNKNLIMTVEEEEIFQLSNKCWICDKLFDLIDEKVRDHCHISGKFRCILKLVKKYL